MAAQTDNRVTVESILGTMKEWIEQRAVIKPSTWVDASAKLNVLLSDEHDRLCQLEQAVATLKLAYLDADTDHNVSAAKARIEATDAYRLMREQRLLCDRVVEFIRIAKLRSRLIDAEMRGN
jgi:hypothetical protein